MTRSPSSKLDPNQIVDQLYEIALDPGSLDGFIDAWNNAGLDAQDARRTMEEIDSFDLAFSAHLKRAETFLNRGDKTAGSASLADTLAPFKSLAALIVDRTLQVMACNEGAQTAFGIRDGDVLDKLPLVPTALDGFRRTLTELLTGSNHRDLLLNMELTAPSRPTLFHLHRLAETGPSGQVMALIVTTQYHWQPALGQTLEEVFQITSAEQGVVRALVEGRDAKTIAADRGTSEGTVRSQIKSILGKMNARSQSEVIRLVLSLRDVTMGLAKDGAAPPVNTLTGPVDWLDAEVWKPFQSIVLRDGRRMFYHDMGPVTGAPILFFHMGYGLVRWSHPMLRLAYQHGLRIICPIRAGYGQSDRLDPKADVKAAVLGDHLELLDHLGMDRLPIVPQGNDLIYAVDMAAQHPERVSEIIGICARPSLTGDMHYAGMAKWHRFFLSTASHSPHLLLFTAKAAVSLARRIGPVEMFRQMNKRSPADMALLNDPVALAVLIANSELIASTSANVAQTYTMEILETERDWSALVHAARDTPTRFINGIEDPALDVATIAVYREQYPWIEIEAVPDAGQLLIYQKYADVIPQLAEAARAAQAPAG